MVPPAGRERMVTDLALLLGQPGQLEPDWDSDRQAVGFSGFTPTTDTENRPDTLPIYNPLLCPGQKAGSLLLCALKQTLRAAFSFQGHSPTSAYIVDGSGNGD